YLAAEAARAERPEECEHRRRERGEAEADGDEQPAIQELPAADAELFLVDGFVLHDLAAAAADEPTECRTSLLGALAPRRLDVAPGRCEISTGFGCGRVLVALARLTGEAAGRRTRAPLRDHEDRDPADDDDDQDEDGKEHRVLLQLEEDALVPREHEVEALT